mmetsp:Transcript_104679/g.300964  ORF Transcript_104679/g.300964 Transcript_104679/m.300964 type:complete len:253 (-) Transcript_104679:539-1297(-)
MLGKASAGSEVRYQNMILLHSPTAASALVAATTACEAAATLTLVLAETLALVLALSFDLALALTLVLAFALRTILSALALALVGTVSGHPDVDGAAAVVRLVELKGGLATRLLLVLDKGDALRLTLIVQGQAEALDLATLGEVLLQGLLLHAERQAPDEHCHLLVLLALALALLAFAVLSLALALVRSGHLGWPLVRAERQVEAPRRHQQQRKIAGEPTLRASRRHAGVRDEDRAHEGEASSRTSLEGRVNV